MTTPTEIRARDAEMKEILTQPIAKTEHRWVTLGFATTDREVTIMQQRKYTFKEYDLKVGEWCPPVKNIVKTEEI